jgi:hypothetical protein
LPDWYEIVGTVIVVLWKCLLLVGRFGEGGIVVLGVRSWWSYRALRPVSKLVTCRKTKFVLNVLLHQVVDVPGRMPSVAVCFEVVLPWPPLGFAICTRDAYEALQCAFFWSLIMPPRLVVPITIVLGRKSDVLDHALGVAALERFCVFVFMLAVFC